MSVEFLYKFLKWGYGENNGPAHWGKMFPIAECGEYQSPIEITEEEVVADSSLQPVNSKFGEGRDFRLENTGMSWQLHLFPEETSLTGGPLQGQQFLAAQMHAHWGAEAGRGSEHVINGKKYDAEIHIVHFNSKYENAGEALDKPDGLAVLGILVKTGKHNPAFEKIVKHLTEVVERGSVANLSDCFDPSNLLPEERSYYTYPGSLTTPPLFESVTWMVFATPIELSPEQLNQMRCMKTGCEQGRCLVDNFRPPADKKARTVRKFNS